MDPLPDTDRRIALLAGRQHGVVDRTQLLAAGISPTMVRHRLRTGRLHRLHRGVYAVGHDALSREARLLAAVLACGPRAALSHRSAAAMWDLVPFGRSRIDVTVASTAGRSGPDGVRLRRSATLTPDDLTTRDGIPLTTVARTLLDTAADASDPRVESLVRRADERELLDLRAVEAAIGRAPGHRGAPRLRQVLARARRSGLTLTLSALEDDFRALCDDHGLPRPAVNARVLGRRRDFTWRAERLVVEADGYAFHRGRAAFERDRVRDQELVAAGWRVVRVTHRQVTEAPAHVAATIRRALAARVG